MHHHAAFLLLPPLASLAADTNVRHSASSANPWVPWTSSRSSCSAVFTFFAFLTLLHLMLMLFYFSIPVVIGGDNDRFLKVNSTC